MGARKFNDANKRVASVWIGSFTGTVIFLPIVERELRVAARKRSTFWVRIIAAIVAMLIGCGFLMLIAVGVFPFSPTTLGRGLFGVLTWLSLAAVLTSGLFLTSDCLSEEKREGTLGLLFLTDLGGYDVVFGKLLATSLRGFYALLAVLPILAITLVMGGVTGEQFWKTSLALVNALFLSLAAGMFVSAISRDSQKALAGTLFLLLLLYAGGPAMDNFWNTRLNLSSPFNLFLEASTVGGSAFWLSFLVNQLVGWFLFGLACWLIPRNWQEKAGKRSTSSDWAQRWKFGGVKSREKLRRKLLGLNPVLWLVCRERWQGGLLWVATILLVGVFFDKFLGNYLGDDSSAFWMIWNYLGGLFTLLLYLGIASQACRFLVDARRSGLIELFLVTPLTVPQIVQGQFRALWRMFGLPLMLCLAIQFCGNFIAQQEQMKMMSAFAAAVPPPPPIAPTTITNTNRVVITTSTTVVPTGGGAAGVSVAIGGGFTTPDPAMILAITLMGTLTVVANLAALVWFGMWMGLNSKSGNAATLKTILFVQIIPWFVISFASTIVVNLMIMPSFIKGGTTAPMNFIFWLPLVMAGVASGLALIKDLVFVICARRLLHSKFRERAAQIVSPIRRTTPPRIALSQVPK